MNHTRAWQAFHTLAVLVLASTLFFGCAGAPATHKTEIAQWLEQVPPASWYPEADILYLLDEQVDEVFEDGRGRSTVHQAFVVLRERGKDEADFQIGYDSRTQRISLVHARTISAQAEIFPLKKDATKTVTPHSEFPEYSDFKELTFSMPTVSVGCIIDLKYVIEDVMPTIPGLFSGNFMVQFMSPVLVSRYRVVTTADSNLNSFVRNPLQNARNEPQVFHEDGKTIYMWEYRDVPQILKEDHMPPLREAACNILVTTATSWEPFFRWWRGEIEGKTKIDAGIRQEVRRLTSGSADQGAVIEALFDYVKREVRYVSVNLGRTGYMPQSAHVVFENKYGDCKDKSTLLVAMLREAGVPAFYVLLPTTDKEGLKAEFPYPFQFDHCIVAVPDQDGYIFVDPTADYSRTDLLPAEDQDRGVLVFEEEVPRFVRTPLLGPEKNRNLLQQEIDIEPDGSIGVSQKRTSSGYYERIMRRVFAEFNPTELEEGFEEYVSGISPGASLLDYSHTSPMDFSHSLSWELRYRANGYCKKAGDMMIFQLPGRGEECTAAEKNERRYPIVQEELSLSEQVSTFNVPEGYRVYHLPERVAIDTPYFEYRAAYMADGDQVVYRSGLALKMRMIPPEEYGAFRDACQKMEKSGKRYVLFRERKVPGH